MRIRSSVRPLGREPFLVPGDFSGRNVDTGDSDVGLVGRMALGDEKAMRAFYERYKAMVGRLARAAGLPEAEGSELVQESFLHAWRSAGSFRGEASAGSWLRGIARHLIADRIDAAVKRRAIFVSTNPGSDAEDYAAPEAVAPEPGPERLLELARAKRCIGECLKKLSTLHREVLSLRICGAELKEQEVANLLAVPLGTVKSRTSIALRALAACVEKCSGVSRA